MNDTLRLVRDAAAKAAHRRTLYSSDENAGEDLRLFVEELDRLIAAQCDHVFAVVSDKPGDTGPGRARCMKCGLEPSSVGP